MIALSTSNDFQDFYKEKIKKPQKIQACLEK